MRFATAFGALLVLGCGGDDPTNKPDAAACAVGDPSCLSGSGCDPSTADCGACAHEGKVCHDFEADLECEAGVWRATHLGSTTNLSCDGGA